MVINHPLSASSIFYDPWHHPYLIYMPDSLFPQSLSKFSLVYLLAWHPPLHTPYISLLNQVFFSEHMPIPSQPVHKLLVKNTFTMDQKHISNHFNEYFYNIGKTCRINLNHLTIVILKFICPILYLKACTPCFIKKQPLWFLSVTSEPIGVYSWNFAGMWSWKLVTDLWYKNM